jgi:hypothetical protein
VGPGVRGSAGHLAVPPGAGGRAPCRQVGTTAAARGPSGGPLASLQARCSIRRGQHRSCTLSSTACGPPRVRHGATRAHAARMTISPHSQGYALAHCETRLRRAVVDGGRLLPRLACPLPEVPTRRQRAHRSAGGAWHGAPRRPASPRVSRGLPMASHARAGLARAGMMLALLREQVGRCAPRRPPRRGAHRSPLGPSEGGTPCQRVGPRGSAAEGR